jgi:integrase
MDKKKVLEDEYVKIWFDEIEAESRTIDNYSHAIYLFCEFTGNTPRQLIEEAEDEIRAGIPLRHRRIKRYLPEFANWVQGEFKEKHGRDIAPKTLKDRMAGVRSFYRSFEIEVPRNQKKINRAETLPENGEIPTIEMVKEALTVASIRNRAIVLAMLNSGFGDSEILSVKVSDFIRGRGYDPHLIGRSEEEIRQWISEEKKKIDKGTTENNLEYGVTTVRARRKKTSQDFFSFITPEASLAILDYLEWRNRKPTLENYRGKYMKGIIQEGYEKRKIRRTDDFIFARNNIPDEFLPLETLKGFYEGTKAYKERYLKSKERREKNGDHPYDEKLRVLARSGLTRVFRELAKKIGVDTGYAKWQVLRGHGLRKLFNSLLLNNGCPLKAVEFWMGHKLPEQRAAYYQANESELKEHYSKHMRVLFTGRIEVKTLKSEEFKVIEVRLKEKDKEFTELTGELEGYREALQKRNGEITKLREEIEAMKSREESREPYDNKMTELMKRLIANPEIKELIKKELGVVKGEKS